MPIENALQGFTYLKNKYILFFLLLTFEVQIMTKLAVYLNENQTSF